MGETADKIESYIDEHRERLGSNLRELEGKVKAAKDWRTHFERHPGIALGLAVGSGALLATLVSPVSRTRPQPHRQLREASTFADMPSPRPVEKLPSQVVQHIDQMKSALVDVVAASVVGYVDTLLPGFKQQVDKRRAR